MGNEGSKEKVSNYSVGFTENELNSLRHEFSKASDGKPNLSLNELQVRKRRKKKTIFLG